jgi:hypothetical protein
LARLSSPAEFQSFAACSRPGIDGIRHSSTASQTQSDEEAVDKAHRLNMVYVALGSNMGDRLKNIEDACDKIDEIPKTKITQTSSLWETKAMYVEDQPDFFNAVCEVGWYSAALLSTFR